MPPIDYNPLRNRIRDLGLTQKECAEKSGSARVSFAKRWLEITSFAKAKSASCATFWALKGLT